MNRAAQSLGRLAAGKPKNYSAAELARRRKRLSEARKKQTMKCTVCKKKSNSGHIHPGFGFSCSDECSQILRGRRNSLHKELRAEPLTEMPDALNTGDFERWSLKLAIHFLNTLTAEDRQKINPMFLIPEELALDFKDRILNHLHSAYVSSVENKGHARLFCGGTYCFRQPVPREKLIEAAGKAQLIAAG